jgi:prepilin-type processing-associated H-X9-DG protein
MRTILHDRVVLVWRSWFVVPIAFLSIFVSLVTADEPPRAMVPADALAVVHIRLADIWKSDALGDLRRMVQKAGSDALHVLDQRFVPAPSSIDRLTIVIGVPMVGPPPVTFVLETSRAFDVDRFVKTTLPNAEEARAGDTTFYIDRKAGIGVRANDDRTIWFGPDVPAVQAQLEKAKSDGALAAVIGKASSATPIVAGVNLALLPPIPRERIPPPFGALLEAKTAIMTVAWERDARINMSLDFADAAKAEGGQRAIRAALTVARQGMAQARGQFEMMLKGENKANPGDISELPEALGGLFGLAMLTMDDEALKDLKLDRKGSVVRGSLVVPGGPMIGGMMAALLPPAVQRIREAANRLSDTNNLRQIALALLNYHDAHGRFPPAAITDKEGKPLLSWRVAILPFIEQQNLYKQFHLDEPWDSKHNRKLLPLMPKIFQVPGFEDTTTTHYRVFTGPDAIFDSPKSRSIKEIHDGISNTWTVVETAESTPWTQPQEPRYAADKPLPEMGHFFSGGFNAAFADGQVRFFRKPPPEETMRALITADGGETIRLEDQ